MIIVITCSHFPDDERIFYRQINSLLEKGLSVTYFTYSNSSIDLSNGLLKHYNYNKKITRITFSHNKLYVYTLLIFILDTFKKIP